MPIQKKDVPEPLKYAFLGFLLCAIVGVICFRGFTSEDFNFGAGLNDWSFDGLPGNYTVLRINSRTICLGESDSGGTLSQIIVDAYVSKIAYNENYIFAQQIPPECVGNLWNRGEPSYFILTVADGTLAGPYSEEEFLAAYETLALEGEADWIKSTELPNVY